MSSLSDESEDDHYVRNHRLGPFQRNLTDERGLLGKMAETLSKRGPDENNLWGGEHVLFGHKRLIVVDPEGGRQPMSIQHEGKSYTICYNGELYNTEDLRDVLKGKGYTFRGHSDTEVLLTSYIEWREACVDHLNGIFAFAVWDEQEGRVFLGRDRLGVNPYFIRKRMVVSYLRQKSKLCWHTRILNQSSIFKD